MGNIKVFCSKRPFATFGRKRKTRTFYIIVEMNDYTLPIDTTRANRLLNSNERELFLKLAAYYNLDIYSSVEPGIDWPPCEEIPYRFFKLVEEDMIELDDPSKRPPLIVA